MSDTFWIGYTAEKLYKQSGQFSSTIKTSLSIGTYGGGFPQPGGITWDGTNTSWCGFQDAKLYLQSGEFSSTLKTSLDVSGTNTGPRGIGWDGADTAWCGFSGGTNNYGVLYLQSGQFSSTLKTFTYINSILGADGGPEGISYDGTNTPFAAYTKQKLYLVSGQFSVTLKTSLDVSGIDTGPSGITWDGTDTPWCGRTADKLYLQSGHFSSTLKTSLDISGTSTVVFGVSDSDVDVRVPPPSHWAKIMTANPANIATDDYAKFTANDLIGRSYAEVLSDIGASPTSHLHDGATLQHDGVNSNGGAFSFTTTGAVTFNQNLVVSIAAASTPASLTVQAAGGTGADAFIILRGDVGEGTVWSLGSDDTGQSFRISENATLGTNDRLIIDEGGVFHLNAITIDDTGTRTVRIGQGVDNGGAGTDNVFLGYRAGYNNAVNGTDGTRNVYVGQESGAGSTGGTDNSGSENVGVGAETLEYCTTGYENTCIGDEAGKGITTGQGNCAMGNDAMQGDGTNAVTGNFNTSLGVDTLYVVQSGGYNVAVGYQCLYKITTLSNIVAIGYQSGYNLVAGETGNVLIGYQTGYYVNQTAGIEGEDNIYIGENAGKGTGATNVGAFNIGVGKSALTAIQSGDANVALGNSAGLVLTTGSNNFCVGNDAGYSLTTGSNNILFGYQSGYSITTLSDTLAIGYQSLYSASINESRNVAIGYQAGYYINYTAGLEGQKNLYIGFQAGKGGVANTGYQNVGIGDVALLNITSGYRNFALGAASMYSNTAGYGNIAIGGDSMYSNDDGNWNIAIGYTALRNATSADTNIAIGAEAMKDTTSGHSNVVIGYLGLYENTTGSQSAGIGYAAMYDNVGGIHNTAVGYAALYRNQNGDYNTIIGDQAGGIGAGSSQADLSYHTCIGASSGNNLANTSASNIFIGYKSGFRQTTNSNLLIVDNQERADVATEITNSLLYGIMAATPAAQSLRINGEILGSDGAKIGDGGTTNYTEIEADGTIEFHGTATVWNDANLGVAQLALPVAAQPDEDEFVDEGGADTGISTWAFAVGEKVSGSIEIPHDYKEGSDIYFHVHWQGITAPTGTDNVKWQCTYTVAQVDATLDAATDIVVETAYDTQYEFKLSSCPAITGTNFNIGDQFLFTLERIVAAGDAYAGDALVATVGIHYECDTVGSRQMLTKA